MKMAIVKKVKDYWSITQIGLNDEEVQLLRSELEKSDLDINYHIYVPFRVVFHQNED